MSNRILQVALLIIFAALGKGCKAFYCPGKLCSAPRCDKVANCIDGAFPIKVFYSCVAARNVRKGIHCVFAPFKCVGYCTNTNITCAVAGGRMFAKYILGGFFAYKCRNNVYKRHCIYSGTNCCLSKFFQFVLVLVVTAKCVNQCANKVHAKYAVTKHSLCQRVKCKSRYFIRSKSCRSTSAGFGVGFEVFGMFKKCVPLVKHFRLEWRHEVHYFGVLQ